MVDNRGAFHLACLDRCKSRGQSRCPGLQFTRKQSSSCTFTLSGFLCVLRSSRGLHGNKRWHRIFSLSLFFLSKSEPICDFGIFWGEKTILSRCLPDLSGVCGFSLLSGSNKYVRTPSDFCQMLPCYQKSQPTDTRYCKHPNERFSKTS